MKILVVALLLALRYTLLSHESPIGTFPSSTNSTQRRNHTCIDIQTWIHLHSYIYGVCGAFTFIPICICTNAYMYKQSMHTKQTYVDAYICSVCKYLTPHTQKNTAHHCRLCTVLCVHILLEHPS